MGWPLGKGDIFRQSRVDVILNIKLIKADGGITLLQSHYVEKVLKRFGFSDCKPSQTPYDPIVTMRKNKRIG
jgi:hypothetical protein